MYTSFFGLHEKPFSITPDPRYLFMSERHGEALAHLVYGVTESGGFIQLTGEVGTGKTTLVRTLLLNRMPDNADVAVVLNPQITAQEFLATICEELGVGVPYEKNSIKALTDALNRRLLHAHAAGRRVVLVVDEAQNLAPAVLEQVRLLTNLETSKQKLLQIILIGQPELRELLDRNDLRQLAQRITGRYHLEPLTREETAQYIEHRLRVAGALGEVFDKAAKQEVFALTGGVPRLVNVICDRALLGAYSLESRKVTRRVIRRAAAEVSGDLTKTPVWGRIGIAAGVISIAVIVASVWSVNRQPDAEESAPEASVSEPVQAPAVQMQALESGAAPEPDLMEQLTLAENLTSSDSAMATLFALWGISYVHNGRDGCEQVSVAGLSCLTTRGSWNGLKQLNRPAILTLTGDDGTKHDVVITAINGDNAELSIGGVIVTHPVADIAELWFGHYRLLWRPPNGKPVSLAPGSRGADVLWLRQSLASIDPGYSSANPDSEDYDAELATIVRRFQQDNRLNIDGLAGNKTQIIVNSMLAADGTPRLTTSRLARD